MQTIANPAAADEHRRAAVDAVASLGQAVGSLRCAGSQRLVRLGISMTHFHVLTLLRHHDAMPMGRIAEILDASMSSATGIIDRMEERGLVERVRVPDDRRIVLVRPTQAGLDLVDEAELVKSTVMASAIERLTNAQIERLTLAAADLRDANDAEIASSPERSAPSDVCGHTAPHGHHGHRAASIAQSPAQSPGSPAGTASPEPGTAGA